jgi:hypothetical protein
MDILDNLFLNSRCFDGSLRLGAGQEDIELFSGCHQGGVRYNHGADEGCET